MPNGLLARLVLPVYERVSGNHFSAQWRRLAAAQWLPAEEIERQALERLRALLVHAGTHVPFYRQRFAEAGFRPDAIREIGDLDRLPLTTKADLREGFPDRVVADNISARRRWPVTTSGSSGQPFRMFLDRASLSYQVGAFAFFTQDWAGISPWSSSLTINSTLFAAGSKYGLPALSARMRRVVLGQRLERLPGSEASLPNFLERIGRLSDRPYWIWAVPSLISTIADQLQEAGRELPAFPVVVMTSGETLTDLDAERIARVFRCRVVNHYAFSEAPHMAQSCPDNPGVLHVNSERGLLRLVRDDGRAAAPGELGRVTVTDLVNWVMPLINFDLGDQALAGQPCPCGRGLPTIARLEGRSNELIRTPAGRLFTQTALTNFIARLPGGIEAVREFQAALTAPDTVVFRIVPGRAFSSELTARIRSDLQALLGPDLRVEVETVESLPREPSGKRLLIRSEQPPGG